LYIYSIANEIAKEGRRKKVTEHDIYQALKEMGFEKYNEELKDFMANYNADKEDTVGKSGLGGGMMPKKRTNGVTVTQLHKPTDPNVQLDDDMQDEDEEEEIA